MFNINGRDIIRLRGDSGVPFSNFVNALIQANAIFLQIPASEIRVTNKITVGDGGVDCEVVKAASKKFQNIDYFDEPTVWQCKAIGVGGLGGNAKAIKKFFSTEINKQYAKGLIEKGYAYRFCICDDITAEKEDKLKTILQAEVRSINSDAKESIIISASKLADMANRVPAVIMQFFPERSSSLQHFETWKKNMVSVTRSFVEIENRLESKEKVVRHCDFSVDQPVILPVQGLPGVGKTRLVYECLASTSGIDKITLYTNDEDEAKDIAGVVANNQAMHVVLVADECSLSARFAIQQTLNGHRGRVRVIAIDNTGDKGATAEPEIWLKPLENDVTQDILLKNFPEIQEGKRHRYVNISGGYIQLAADLCVHTVVADTVDQSLPPLDFIEEYLKIRLGGQLESLAAIAMVKKIGYRGDLEDEILKLCNLLGGNPKQLIQTALDLKEQTGFIKSAGRYFYSTPDVVSRVAFCVGWKKWAKDNFRDFLEKIPSELQEGFLDRVKYSAPEEVRQIISDFFRTWALIQNQESLKDLKRVNKFIQLCEMDPPKYVPIIDLLINSSDISLLTEVTGDYSNGWGPRRQLVWFAERIAAFEEFFNIAERILLKLALAENEKNLGNSATNIWCQLFRINLSGSSLSFNSRLELLKKRILSGERNIQELSLLALKEIFEQSPLKIVGPVLFGSRVVPEQWRARTVGDLQTCYRITLATLAEIVGKMSAGDRERILDIVADNTRHFMMYDLLDEFKVFIEGISFSEKIRLKILDGLEDHLEYDFEMNNPAGDLRKEKIKAFLSSMAPLDYHGELVVVVGKEPWRYLESDQNTWKSRLVACAEKLISEDGLLESELAWLSSNEAKSAQSLGIQLGLRDKGLRFLDLILFNSTSTKSTFLANGYLYGLMEAYPEKRDIVSGKIALLAEKAPGISAQLALARPDEFNAFSLSVNLYKKAQIEGIRLCAFLFGMSPSVIGRDELEILLDLLLSAIRKEERNVLRLTIEGIGYIVHKDKESDDPRWKSEKALRLIFEILELGAVSELSDSFWWGEVISQVGKSNPFRSIQIIIKAMLAENSIRMEDMAVKALTQFCEQDPKLVFQCLLEALTEEESWRLIFSKLKSLIFEIPLEIVKECLPSADIATVRKLARHLPAPYIDDRGNPVIPDITGYILASYQGDDEVFMEFCAGVHSMKVYGGIRGQIANQFEEQALVAEKFMDSSIKRISEWARIERASSLEQARKRREMDAEEEAIENMDLS